MKNQTKIETAEKEERVGWVIPLFLIALIFCIGRIGWGMGHHSAMINVKAVTPEGVHFRELPARPHLGDLYFFHSEVLVYTPDGWYFADIVPAEKFID
jgi:hypothetical protein